VANLKAILAEHEDGARIVLSADDVTFVGTLEDGDDKSRVKHLGIYQIDIALKGGSDVLKRTIKISAQE
jgi:hypothetical protein